MLALHSPSVQIANFQTYVHLTSGVSWSTCKISRRTYTAHFLADFSGSVVLRDNTVRRQRGVPSAKWIQRPFLAGRTRHHAPGTVDGVFVEASTETNDPNENLVANLGADWWRDSSAPYVDGFSPNPGAGVSDWVKLTTEWKTLYFTSFSPEKLQADPPPGLENASPPATTPLATTPPDTTPPATTPPGTDVGGNGGDTLMALEEMTR